jgi:glutathione S-transferase
MKIYDMAGLPNPARIRIALAEKGVTDQVDFVAVDFMNGEHRTPAFREKNPDATVPLLELDDGTYISHCNAITEYIDQHFDGPSLCGTVPAERAIIQMMNLRAQEGLLDALITYFHHATPGLGPVLETYQLPEWGLRQRERALATMHYLDGVLGERAYLAGDVFSVADITAFAGISFADFAKVEVPTGLTNLTAWRTRIAARPSCAG